MREDNPLETVGGDDDVLYTWRHLLTFCRANPKLTTTATVVERYRELSGDGTAGQGSHPALPVTLPSTSGVTSGQPTLVGQVPGGSATLRSALDDLKTQVEDHASVVLATARLADDAARIHRGLVERLQVLEAAAGNQN